MIEIFQMQFMQHALISALLASVACGIIGTYVVSRRMVFVSGGISHTAYGGVGLGIFLGVPPILGAGVFSLAAAVGIGLVQRRLKASADTAIGIIWAVGVALGVIFVSMYKGPKPDLMSYLFGSILAVSTFDLMLMAILDVIIAGAVILLYKEFLAISFDEEYSEASGLKVEILYLLMLALVALTVVIMIRVAGIILVIALLTIPPATARIFSKRLDTMMFVSVMLIAICSVAGVILCYPLNLPAGPVIIILSALVYLASFAVARIQKAL